MTHYIVSLRNGSKIQVQRMRECVGEFCWFGIVPSVKGPAEPHMWQQNGRWRDYSDEEHPLDIITELPEKKL